MPAIQPLVLTDDTTPVTFNPIGRKGDRTLFRTTDAANQAAQSTLSVSVQNASASQRLVIKLDEPLAVLDSDTGETVVTEHAIGEINLRIPSKMDNDDRVAFVKRYFSMLSDASLQSVVEGGDGFWS